MGPYQFNWSFYKTELIQVSSYQNIFRIQNMGPIELETY